MNAGPQVVRAAVDAVVAWARSGRSVRDVIAANVALRQASGALRAQVSALATAAVTLAIRHEFLLAGDDGLRGLSAPARGEALVLAAAVANGAWAPEDAAAAFAAVHRSTLPFAALTAPAAAFALNASPERAFAREHSVPEWFATAALQAFGEQAAAVARALSQPAPRTLRANLLVVRDRAELVAELAAAGIATRAATYAATALHVDGDVDLFATGAYARGAFEQQDEASQVAVAAVAPPPGGKVLDLCAGNGGKTLALAAALRNRGQVLATDVHLGRLQGLRERLRRARADNVQVAAIGEHDWPEPVRTFAANADRILIDAPCSGTGSWRRRPEGRHAIDAVSLRKLVATQDDLLRRAAAVLRPGARLCYATCSLLPTENEARIDALCAADSGLERVRMVEVLGGAFGRSVADATGTFLVLRPDRHGCDGFFLAILRRR